MIVIPYILLGIYGNLWVSDEFDEVRRVFYGYFLIPFSLLFLSAKFLFSEQVKSLKSFYQISHVVIILGFLWGNVLLINAVLREKKELLNIVEQTDEDKKSYVVSMKRGGLGLIYRTRW